MLVIKLTFFGKQLLKATALAQDISKKMILLTFINITLDLSKTCCLYCIWFALILLNTSCKCTRDTHEQSGPPRGGGGGGRRGHYPGARGHKGARGSKLSGLECNIHQLKLRPADAMMFLFYFGPKFEHLRTL